MHGYVETVKGCTGLSADSSYEIAQWGAHFVPAGTQGKVYIQNNACDQYVIEGNGDIIKVESDAEETVCRILEIPYSSVKK